MATGNTEENVQTLLVNQIQYLSNIVRLHGTAALSISNAAEQQRSGIFLQVREWQSADIVGSSHLLFWSSDLIQYRDNSLPSSSHKSPKSHRVVIWTEKWTWSNKLRMGHLALVDLDSYQTFGKNLSVPPFQLPSVGSPLKAQQWPPRHSGNQGSPQICPFSSPGRPDSICSTQGVVSDLCWRGGTPWYEWPAHWWCWGLKNPWQSQTKASPSRQWRLAMPRWCSCTSPSHSRCTAHCTKLRSAAPDLVYTTLHCNH